MANSRWQGSLNSSKQKKKNEEQNSANLRIKSRLSLGLSWNGIESLLYIFSFGITQKWRKYSCEHTWRMYEPFFFHLAHYQMVFETFDRFRILVALVLKKKKKTNAANRASAKNDCGKTERLNCMQKNSWTLFFGIFFFSLKISCMMLTR